MMTDRKQQQLYWAGEPYKTTLEQVITALSSKESMVAITGDRGVGKSAFARELEQTLISNNDAVLFFETPPKSNTDFHQQCRQQHKALDRFAFMVALEKWLVNLNKSNQRCVLIVDNAHLLNAEVITTIRVMNNLQSTTHRLLQVVLLGEKQMFKVLGNPSGGGLSQRISLQTELQPLNKMQLKQMMFDLFTLTLDQGSLALLYKLSRGNAGVAIKAGEMVHQELGPASINRQQLVKAISKDPLLTGLLNKNRMKLLLPVAAVVVVGVAVWQMPQDLLNPPTGSVKAEPEQPQTTVEREDQTLTTSINSATQQAGVSTSDNANKDKTTSELTESDNQQQTDEQVAQQDPVETLQSTADEAISETVQNIADGNQADMPTETGENTETPLLASADNTDINPTNAQLQGDNPAPSSDSQAPLSDAQDPAAVQNDTPTEVAQQPQDEPQPSQSLTPTIEQEVTMMLQNWVGAWQTKDISGYIDSYIKEFRPTNGETTQQWIERRTNHITKIEWMRVSLGEMEVLEHSDDKLTLRVWLEYASPGYEDQTLKELNLVLREQRWLIEKERNKLVKRGETVFSATP